MPGSLISTSLEQVHNMRAANAAGVEALKAEKAAGVEKVKANHFDLKISENN